MEKMQAVALAAALAAIGGCAGTGGGGAADGGADAAAELLEAELRVPAGGYLAIRVDGAGGIEAVDPPDPYGDLAPAAQAAVDAAPEWTRPRLTRTLARLVGATAEKLAAQIAGADALVRDEIAWSVAVTDAPLLEWIVGNGDEALFAENAAALYAADAPLDYAAIVELDGDQTTLALTGADGEYQLDPEMYYWYVVYPRAYFELPAYVGGELWRSFLAEDDAYGAALLDTVAGAPDVGAAAARVGEWVQSFMAFGYGSNLLQPIEIYDARFGSCGEYSILTTAAARIALVPTAAVSARADDHEWNEYWDGRWIMWDNSLGDIAGNPQYPYLDWPEIYDDDTYGGAGVLGQVAYVLRFRSDDAIFGSEVAYTPTEEVDVAVRDAAGEPVEGARVIVTTMESGGLPCAWGYTDAAGKVAFDLGNQLGYTVLVTHDLLGAPADETHVGTDHAGPIPLEIEFDVAYPRAVEDLGAPDGETAFAAEVTVARAAQHRRNGITEDYALGLTHEVEIDGGSLDLYLVDEEALAALAAGAPFGAYAPAVGAGAAELELRVPAAASRYLVLDNRMWPVSDKIVSVRVERR